MRGWGSKVARATNGFVAQDTDLGERLVFTFRYTVVCLPGSLTRPRDTPPGCRMLRVSWRCCCVCVLRRKVHVPCRFHS